MRRPRRRTTCWASSASLTPSPGASDPHSSGVSRSVPRPAASWSRSLRSSRRARQRSRSTWGTSTSQVATSALRIVASRSPPADSLRSGTETWASSPFFRTRSLTASRSWGRLRRASRRHPESTSARSRSVVAVSPARCRASSSPRATRTSARAAAVTSARARTEWSSGRPLSHSGYQTWPATSATTFSGTCSSWTSTTSRSEKGASSSRPYPPTATRATPLSGRPSRAASSAEAHRRSASAVRC